MPAPSVGLHLRFMGLDDSAAVLRYVLCTCLFAMVPVIVLKMINTARSDAAEKSRKNVKTLFQKFRHSIIKACVRSSINSCIRSGMQSFVHRQPCVHSFTHGMQSYIH